MDYDEGYVNGYVERSSFGGYLGKLTIEGITFPSIEGTYFKQDGNTYLFLKRRPIMEYDYEKGEYKTREPRPQVKIYMQKQVDGDGVVAFKGDFMFMRFKFNIIGVWDMVLGKDKKRLNLFVERAPRKEQTLLIGIAKRKSNEK